MEEIILNCLRGEACAEARAELSKWLSASAEHRAQYAVLKKVWEARACDPPAQQANDQLKKIWQAGTDGAPEK